MNRSIFDLKSGFPVAWKMIVHVGVALSFAASQVPASAATLASLVDGGFIDVGGSRFSDWELLTLDATTGTLPVLSQISVNPLSSDPTRPGLSYVANGQLATLGINAMDLSFRFRVRALTGGKAYAGQSLDLTNITIGKGTGLAYLSEEIADVAGGDLGSTLVMADNGTDFFKFSDQATFAQRFNLSVSTNVFLTGLSGADTVNVSTFTQRFTQTGAQLLGGDYNSDGRVDAADYTVWRNTLGQSGIGLPADGDGDNTVTSLDYGIWKMNYGETAGSGSVANRVSVVPEPSSLTLTILALCTCRLRRRRAT